MNMIWAYYRVSTDDQDYENQRSGVLKFCEYRGLEIEREVIEEGISGKTHFKKRKLGLLMNDLQRGDVLIVSELSRLSRQMTDCFELAKMFNEKGVTVHCVKENMEISNSALGLMVMSVFAFSAQIERERISERTKEALQRKKAEGVKLGRKYGSKNKVSKIDQHAELLEQYIKEGFSLRTMSKMLGVSVPLIRKYIKEKNNE